jgi:hypothetical protein
MSYGSNLVKGKADTIMHCYIDLYNYMVHAVMAFPGVSYRKGKQKVGGREVFKPLTE